MLKPHLRQRSSFPGAQAKSLFVDPHPEWQKGGEVPTRQRQPRLSDDQVVNRTITGERPLCVDWRKQFDLKTILQHSQSPRGPPRDRAHLVSMRGFAPMNQAIEQSGNHETPTTFDHIEVFLTQCLLTALVQKHFCRKSSLIQVSGGVEGAMAQRVEEHLVEGDAVEERHGQPEALFVAGARDAPLE